MNKDNNGQSPITDDAELAKVLEGMNPPAAAEQLIPTSTSSGLQFEETSPADIEPATSNDMLPVDVPAIALPKPLVSAPAGDLEGIKKDALEELRPLVDKLNLPAEEKFDTILLIIRSTDDHSLIGAAHDAAKTIEDETKRAQALLDVIKEIDYFATQK